MADEETIRVANVSGGPGQGAPVELPVVELLTGRAFLTGKSGSGKSNTASVVVERLLDRGFGVLIVDIEGEYYGLKEEYEILHAGADEECDIQVSEEHAGKLASLALEQNVPIILDLSGFLHEEDARDLLKAVARQLFAKEKKVKQPFLMVVEEVHEYVPEGGGMDECGRMLVKVAKRGRKHGLGVAGISQRPADVKKDFITQCDWLVWHRLTWQNDTRVVKRVLGADYADAIEDLDDGEGFLMTDWGEDVRRVQFHRKETFDAGATPGLDDFERPDLKSVSGDLVSELEVISEEQAAREDEIGSLKRQLEEREQRIAELEEELAEARDLSDMAEQFARALTEHASTRNPVTGQPAPANRPPAGRLEGTPSKNGHDAADEGRANDETGDVEAQDGGADGHVDGPERVVDRLDDALPEHQRAIVEDAAAANAAGVSDVTIEPAAGDRDGGDERSVATATDPPPGDAADGGGEASAPTGLTADGASTAGAAHTGANGDDDGPPTDAIAADGSASTNHAGETTPAPGRGRTDDAETAGGSALSADGPGTVADELRQRVADLHPVARSMLACYRDMGVATPESVHAAAGESGERPTAYGHNRELRRKGFVVHVGGGRYAYALPSLVAANTGDDLDDDERRSLRKTVEQPL